VVVAVDRGRVPRVQLTEGGGIVAGPSEQIRI
jgi:hypothetical protein